MTNIMKNSKLFTVSACLLFAVLCSTSEIKAEEAYNISIGVTEGAKTVSKTKSKKRGFKRGTLEIGGIGLGYNGMINNLGDLSLPEEYSYLDQEAKSINFNLYILNYTYNVTRNFGFGTGLELEVNNFRFENNMTIIRDADGIIGPDWSYTERGIYLSKSKLVTCYLNVPLFAKVTWGRSNWQLYGGLMGGWRIGSHTKIKTSSDQMKGKHKNHKNLNLRNFHYGYTAGLSYKYYGIYATYYPTSIFKPDIGPDIQQVNVGISLRFW